jgi:hypothetical protein
MESPASSYRSPSESGFSTALPPTAEKQRSTVPTASAHSATPGSSNPWTQTTSSATAFSSANARTIIEIVQALVADRRNF